MTRHDHELEHPPDALSRAVLDCCNDRFGDVALLKVKGVVGTVKPTFHFLKNRALELQMRSAGPFEAP